MRKLLKETQHNMTRWLIAKTVSVQGGKIEYTIPEHPLLHACCAEDHFGDVNIDIRPEVHPDKVCDITQPLPFPPDSFAAAFADFPWINSWKCQSARAINQLLIVAPIVYTISPWMLGTSAATPETIYVSQRPGINNPILFIKYVRNNKKEIKS